MFGLFACSHYAYKADVSHIWGVFICFETSSSPQAVNNGKNIFFGRFTQLPLVVHIPMGCACTIVPLLGFSFLINTDLWIVLQHFSAEQMHCNHSSVL